MGWTSKRGAADAALVWMIAMTGCPLDSKSLGEDEGASDESGDESVGESGDDEPPAPAEELRRSEIDDTTPSEIAVGPDGSIYVVGRRGYTWDAEAFDGDFASVWIAELDAAGEIVWERTEDVDRPRTLAVAATSDGFVLTTTAESIDAVATIARYDGSGEPLWSIETPQFPRRVAVGPDDRIAVAGITVIGADRQDAWTAEYEGSTGDLAWETDVGTGDVRSSHGESVAFTPDGDVIVGGGQGVAELTGRSRAFLARVDPNGETIWEQTYSEGVESDGVIDVVVTSDGTIHAAIVADEIHSIRRFDGDGTETFAWDATLVDAVTAIAVADDGSFVATDGGSADAAALRIARHDADGHARWFGERDDCALGVDVVILPNDEVLVAGACPPAIEDAQVATGLFTYAP
jgi:outer membrane protein assembly factor BamB